MSARLSAITSLVPLLLVTTACRSPKPRDRTGEIRAAAAAFDAAQLHRDRATLERFLASDFVFVRGAGVVADRDAFIASFTDPGTVLDPFTIVKPVFVPLGDRSGLVGGEVVLSGTEAGKRFSEHIRYADVFTWRDERWQVVYVQVTVMK